MPIDQSIIDEFAASSALVVQMMLDYAQLTPAERTESGDGQVRRVRGMIGALQAAANAAAERPAPPSMPASPMPVYAPR
jgi:hypothetical protein